MDNKNRVELDIDQLDQVNGGAIGFNPDGTGKYTMKCQFSGKSFPSITLEQIIQIAKFAAGIPNTPEGEEQILAWAHGKGYI